MVSEVNENIPNLYPVGHLPGYSTLAPPLSLLKTASKYVARLIIHMLPVFKNKNKYELFFHLV